MIEPQEIQFGRIAVKLGFLRSNHLAECLGMLEKMKQQGSETTLSSLLQDRGYLTSDQADQILQASYAQSDIKQSPSSCGYLPETKVHPGLEVTQKRGTISETRIQSDVKPISETISRQSAPSSTITQTIDLSAGNHFGRYKIIDLIGQGGMGRVYKVYDPQLDRIVALKMLLSTDTQIDVERFLREAKSTAKLRHPHIVNVYDIGNENGRNFFTMDFIEGASLSEMVRKKPLKLANAVSIMKKIGEAIHYAHEQGIIHRDLKPANIMLDKDGEPKVMDFGLAKVMGSNEQLSKTGMVIGTIQYMPPEQADGKIREIDVRSDVYALGAILYECITGRAPFVGTSFGHILQQVMNEDPPLPSTLRYNIPKSLEEICLKALDKKKQNRYQTAAEFAKDLSLFERGKAIKAGSKRMSRKLMSLWKRYKIGISIGVLLFLGIFIGIWATQPKTPTVLMLDKVEIVLLTEPPYQIDKAITLKINGLYDGDAIPNLEFQTDVIGKAELKKKMLSSFYVLTPRQSGSIRIIAQEKKTGKEGSLLLEVKRSLEGKEPDDPTKLPDPTKPKDEKLESMRKEAQAKELYDRMVNTSLGSDRFFRWKNFHRFPPDLFSTSYGKKAQEELDAIEKEIKKEVDDIISILKDIEAKKKPELFKNLVLRIKVLVDNNALLIQIAKKRGFYNALLELETLNNRVLNAYQEWKKENQKPEGELTQDGASKRYRQYLQFQEVQIPESISKRKFGDVLKELEQFSRDLAGHEKFVEQVKGTIEEVQNIQSLFLRLSSFLKKMKEKEEPIQVTLINGKSFQGPIRQLGELDFRMRSADKGYIIRYIHLKARSLEKLVPENEKNSHVKYHLGKILWYDGEKEAAIAYMKKADEEGNQQARSFLEKQGHAPSPKQGLPLKEEKDIEWSKMDINKDGKIDGWEWKGSPEEFKKLDQNKDGFITQDELPRKQEKSEKTEEGKEIEGKEYVDRERKFSVAFPKDWTVKHSNQNVVMLLSPLEGPDDEIHEGINIVKDVQTGDISLEEYLEASRKAFHKVVNEYRERETTDFEWEGLKGKAMRLSHVAKIGNKNYNMEAVVFLFVKGNKGYMLFGNAREETLGKYYPLFEAIVRTFKILD